MGFIQKIISAGVVYGKSDSEKRNIRLANYISIVTALACVFTLIGRLLFWELYFEWTVRIIIGFVLFLLPLPLNRIGLTLTSRLILCWIPPLFLITTSILAINDNKVMDTSLYVGVRYFYLSMICFPFLVFNLKDTIILILGLAGVLIPLLFYDPLLNLFGAGYYQQGLHDTTYLFNNVRAVISVLIIGFSCFFLKRLIEKSEELNEHLIKELREKNIRIAEQNEDLHEHQEELRAINQNLEGLVNERTEKIKIKNDQLTKYAFTNAHKVRGPLARIQGLIGIAKFENTDDYKFLFEKIQIETADMDSITREINAELDKHIDD